MYESEGGTKPQQKRTKKKLYKMDWVGRRGQKERGRRGDISGGGASVRRGLRAERRQRGRKHQHFGLHEGKVGQTCDHFGRLLAQILLLPRLPVEQEETDRR